MKKSKLSVETGRISVSPCVALIFLITLITAFIHLTRQKTCILGDQQLLKQQKTKIYEINNSSCDLFSGKWVFDNVSYPLYEEARCSLQAMSSHACHKYGRKDLTYQHWRWQPHHCNLPR